MIESKNEQQLRVVLQNYDAKRVECENLEKENARLKQELAQQKVLYRNMLNRYVGKGLEKEGSKDWKEKYDKLREKYDKKNEKFQLLANENSKVRDSCSIVCVVPCALLTPRLTIAAWLSVFLMMQV